jgi:hexokinase
MSPVQRAAALKKQQKYMREMEELNKPEWEKKKTVMSMRINEKGKLVKTYETVKAPMPTDAEHEDINEEVATNFDISEGEKKMALNNNPLLDGGILVRPIWKAPEGEKGKGREATFRQNKWRRVQDDQEDERWILNGGLHGYEDDNECCDG